MRINCRNVSVKALIDRTAQTDFYYALLGHPKDKKGNKLQLKSYMKLHQTMSAMQLSGKAASINNDYPEPRESHTYDRCTLASRVHARYKISAQTYSAQCFLDAKFPRFDTELVSYCNAWCVTPWGYTIFFGRRWGYTPGGYTQHFYNAF